jgi:hypothetical protein
MRIVAQFDPSLKTTDTFNSTLNNGVGKIVAYNESNISLQFNFSDGSTAYVPAWTAVLYCVKMADPTITWKQLFTMSSSGSPLSIVIVEVYDAHEQVIGTFPAALVRQTNIGNSVNTVGGSANNIQNDNNVAGTSIVESTVSGDGASAVSLTNDAILVLGSTLNKGSFLAKGPVTLNDKLTTLGDTSLAQTIKFVNTNPVHIQQLNGADFIFESPASTEVGRISNAGVFDLSAISTSKIKFLVGTISRISMFSAAVTTVTTSFAHGLGVIPDIVLLQQVGGATTIRTVMYNSATMTSTNVDLTGSSSFNVVGLAIKF